MKIIFYALAVCIILLNAFFFVGAHSFLAMYWLVWVGGVGGYLWKHKEDIERRLAAWRIPGFLKFLGLGIFMILCEETLAGTAMHLSTAHSINDIVIGILQFYAFNLLALPGIVIGWYVLMRNIYFTRKEIFIIVGLFGLFAEKTFVWLIALPPVGVLLILPTMFTYMIILAPSVVSYRGVEGRHPPAVVRYLLGFVVPFVCAMPLIGVLMILLAHFPGAFPGPGMVG